QEKKKPAARCEGRRSGQKQQQRNTTAQQHNSTTAQQQKAAMVNIGKATIYCMKTQYIVCGRKSHVSRFRAPESKKPHGEYHAAGKEAERITGRGGQWLRS